MSVLNRPLYDSISHDRVCVDFMGIFTVLILIEIVFIATNRPNLILIAAIQLNTAIFIFMAIFLYYSLFLRPVLSSLIYFLARLLKIPSLLSTFRLLFHYWLVFLSMLILKLIMFLQLQRLSLELSSESCHFVLQIGRSSKFAVLVLTLQINLIRLIILFKCYFLHFTFTPFSEDCQVNVPLTYSFLILCKLHFLNLSDRNRFIVFYVISVILVLFIV